MGRTQRLRGRRAPKPTTTTKPTLHGLYDKLHGLGWRNETQLSAINFQQTGRGLCSKRQGFQAGDELIRLPANALISIATLEADENFKALFDKDLFDEDERISFQALLACYLMHHQHLRETSQGSPLAAYLDTLPQNLTMPYFCPKTELHCLPDELLDRTVSQNRKILAFFEVLKKQVGDDYCRCCKKRYCTDIWTLADFKRAYFAVNSRSVYVDGSQLLPKPSYFQLLLNTNVNMALAPFLDLFNHSDSVKTTAELQLAPGGKCHDYVLTLNAMPVPELKPYDQLFISYGPLSNLQLLVEYGFFLERNAHEYFEFTLLDIELIVHNIAPAAQVCHSNVFKFIRDHNLNDQMFVHMDEGCSHNLRVVLYLIFKQKVHYPNVLSQVAFGDVAQLDDLHTELSNLLLHKIGMYQGFATELKRVPQLTECGAIAHAYLIECVRFLREYCTKHMKINFPDPIPK